MIAEWLNVDLMTKYSPLVCNLISVQIQQLCDNLRGLLREYWGADSIMKSKEHLRKVRDKAMEKFKAKLSYRKIPQALNNSGSAVQSIIWKFRWFKTYSST